MPVREKARTMNSFTRWLSVAAAVVFVIGGTLATKDHLSSILMRQSLGGAYEELVEENGSLMFRATPYTEYSAQLDSYAEDTAVTGVMMTSAKRSAEPAAGSTGAAANDASDEQKIIRTASLTIATQTYDDSLYALRTSCQEQGGWIESSSESTNSRSGLRTAYLTLRIPQSVLDAFLAEAETLGRVTSRSESAQDVTDSYQDTQNRLNTQLALMERLQALINESGDLSDLLALESQIADTQYTIDALQSALATTDNQVTYATVSITLQEEKTVELTDGTVSFGDRVLSAIQVGWNTLTGFLGDAAIFLVAALPFLTIVAVAVIVIKIIHRRKK